jgi:peptidyl-tRNA hydrolase, PTH1 family
MWNRIISIFAPAKEKDAMKYLIAGLGNIGSEYENTRHNVGFKVAETLAEAKESKFTTATLGSVATIKHKGRTIILLKPSTYMNRSGKAVNYYLQKENIPTENLLVVLDDIALPFGKQRLRANGNDGGHNGLKDIDQTLGHNKYARLRIGIGNDFYPGGQAEYVLGKWSEDENKQLTEILKYACDTVLSFTSIGIQHTMNQYNKK